MTPYQKNQFSWGYHSVNIVAIEVFKGQLVAPCKMSNGAKIANQGYVRVSLGVTCHYFVIMLRLFILHSGHNISFLIFVATYG